MCSACVCMCSPWYVVINCGTSVQKDNDPHQRGRDQHLGVETQPGKVETNLLTKVLSAERKKLLLFNKSVVHRKLLSKTNTAHPCHLTDLVHLSEGKNLSKYPILMHS